VNRALITAVLAIVLAATVVPERGDTAPTKASRLIDRTFSCNVPIQAGARERLSVSAVSGFRDPDNRPNWKWKPGAEVRNATFFEGTYARVSAGSPPVTGLSAVVSATRCRPAARSIPLTPAGLVGGRASQLIGNTTVGTDTYECGVPSRILVRLRAAFRTPVTFKVRRVNYVGGGRVWTTTTAAVVREGQLAVRTETGRPLAYASVSQAGPARLFGSARSCVFE
jgi:hypothetical protein